MPAIDYTFTGDDGDFDVEAHLNGVRVGWAWGTRAGDRVNLANIDVTHDGLRRGAGLPWFIRQWLPTRRLRRRGIGSALLRRVLREADADGVREVWGCVTQKDLTESPFLLRWYERHGFAIGAPDDECMGNAVKKIVRRR